MQPNLKLIEFDVIKDLLWAISGPSGEIAKGSNIQIHPVSQRIKFPVH